MQPAQLKKVSFSVPIEHVFDVSKDYKADKPEAKLWTNSDAQSVNQLPRNVRSALSGNAVKVEIPEVQTSQEPHQEQKPSWFKKALTVVGLLVAIPGTIACFSLMAILGPVALAIAFACGVVGAIITAAGSKIR
jgi:hypothetical protein